MADEGCERQDPQSVGLRTLVSAPDPRWHASESRRVAGRYDPLELLGTGAHGVVWKARDAVTGSLVALKRITALAADPGRCRREIATLRALRVPGVVRLLDDGLDDGCAFIVMELVVGTPFPGGATPSAWSAIVGAVIALLETLARIHAAGIVHRDLKPANVLVGDGGRVTVLDFGVSFDMAPHDRLTAEGLVVGTPAYLAPEQLVAEPVTPSADLYAVGTMLYEALSGRLPFDSPSVMSTLTARVTRAASPLREVAPEVPDRVARVVDQLLSRSPADRPRSATEVLALIRGGPALPVGPLLPRLGSDEPLRVVVAAASERRSLDLVGPAGSGRSRLLHDASAALVRDGWAVAHTVPGRSPPESLVPVIGAPGGENAGRLQDVLAQAERRVRALLADRSVLVVDDVERVDRWSAALIDHVRGDGVVLRARLREAPGEPALALLPLAECDLVPLFAGPERVFHIPTDAARSLWTRTDGMPLRVVEEIDAWVRAGLARRDGARFIIDRDALERLESGLPIALVAPGPTASTTSPTLASLPPELDDLLSVIALAWPHTKPETIAAAASLP
jgi:hypothetical protein